jgi:glc operon protein GlcG
MRLPNLVAGLCAVVLVAGLQEAYAQPRLTAENVQQVLSAAVARAQQMKVPMGISVVDASGTLVGFIKMEGAMLHTDRTSFSKAYTAASVRQPTHEMVIPPEIVAAIAETTGGQFTGLPGGLPLVIGGLVVGAIGVGGGTGEQDIEVARAGVQALAP